MYYPVISLFDMWFDKYKEENKIDEKSLKEMLQAAFLAGEDQGHKSERWMMSNVEEEEPPLPDGGKWIGDDEETLNEVILKYKTSLIKKEDDKNE